MKMIDWQQLSSCRLIASGPVTAELASDGGSDRLGTQEARSKAGLNQIRFLVSWFPKRSFRRPEGLGASIKRQLLSSDYLARREARNSAARVQESTRFSRCVKPWPSFG